MKPTKSPTVTAYIGLGSNLDDPLAQIKSARMALRVVEGIREAAFSGLYRSPPMGPRNQPDYVNAVMAMETSLAPMELLRILQAIEKKHRRVRTGDRWGPRTLDLDLLLYGQEVIDLPELKVPHVGVDNRAFVLYPLREVAPALVIPGKGALAELIRHCPRDGLLRLEN